MSAATAAHTAAPWQWEQLPGGRWVLTGGPLPTPVILTVDKDEFGPLTDDQANRTLIAAAPKLLKAARHAYEMSPFHSQDCDGLVEATEGAIFDETVGCTCFLGELKAAIEKALGGQRVP